MVGHAFQPCYVIFVAVNSHSPASDSTETSRRIVSSAKVAVGKVCETRQCFSLVETSVQSLTLSFATMIAKPMDGKVSQCISLLQCILCFRWLAQAQPIRTNEFVRTEEAVNLQCRITEIQRIACPNRGCDRVPHLRIPRTCPQLQPELPFELPFELPSLPNIPSKNDPNDVLHFLLPFPAAALPRFCSCLSD